MAELLRSTHFPAVLGALVLLLGAICWGAIILQAIETLFGGETDNLVPPVEKD